MSGPTASPIPDASTTVAGQVNISIQAFAGLKTFQDGIAVGADLTMDGHSGPNNGVIWLNTAHTRYLWYDGSLIQVGGGATSFSHVLNSAVTATNDAFKAITGARWHIGGGTTDYFTSDGSLTISAAQHFSVLGNLAVSGTINSSGVLTLTSSALTSLSLTNSATTGTQATIASSNAASFSNLRLTNDVAAILQFGLFGSTRTAYGAVLAGEGNLYTTAVAVTIMADNAAGVVKFATGGNLETARVDKDGQYIGKSYTDDSATSGNRTVNKVRGKNAFAIGAATCVITDSFITANSQVICTLEFGDATLTQILRCTPAAGSCTVTGNANATAATKFSWFVIN